MKKYLFIILFLFFSSQKSNCQNLIRNYSFEEGSGTPGDNGQCTYGAPTNHEADLFDADIDWWKSARKITGNGVPSVDWLDYSLCPGYFCASPVGSNRCIRFLSESGYHEGVRIGLPSNLTVGQKYNLKIHVAPCANDIDYSIRFHFAKWGEHWDSNNNNNQKWSDATIIGFHSDANNEYAVGKWYTFDRIIGPVPDGFDQLNNFIIIGENGSVLIDDVVLTEYCPDNMYIENTNYYTPEPPYEAKNITAGYSVDPNQTDGDVIVKNGASITYKAEQAIDLEPGFEVEEGGEFEAFIAPCVGCVHTCQQ